MNTCKEAGIGEGSRASRSIVCNAVFFFLFRNSLLSMLAQALLCTSVGPLIKSPPKK